MSISQIPKSRLGALNIGSADIGTAGLPVSVLNTTWAGGTVADGWYITWSVGYNSWVPTPSPSFSVTYVDGEIPSGLKNSSNKIF